MRGRDGARQGRRRPGARPQIASGEEPMYPAPPPDERVFDTRSGSSTVPLAVLARRPARDDRLRARPLDRRLLDRFRHLHAHLLEAEGEVEGAGDGVSREDVQLDPVSAQAASLRLGEEHRVAAQAAPAMVGVDLDVVDPKRIRLAVDRARPARGCRRAFPRRPRRRRASSGGRYAVRERVAGAPLRAGSRRLRRSRKRCSASSAAYVTCRCGTYAATSSSTATAGASMPGSAR